MGGKKNYPAPLFLGGFYIPLFSLAFFPIPWIGAGFPWPTDDFRQAALRALGFEVKKEDAAAPKWLRSSPVLLDEFGDEKNSPIYKGLVSSLEHLLFSRIYGIILLANILGIILANINDGLVKPSFFFASEIRLAEIGNEKKGILLANPKIRAKCGDSTWNHHKLGVHPWKWWFFAF